MGSGQRKLRQSAAPAASLREKSHGLFSVVTKYPSHVIISPSGAVLRQVMEGKEPHRRTGKQTVPLLSVGKSRACWKLENHALPPLGLFVANERRIWHSFAKWDGSPSPPAYDGKYYS
uniref:Uncharacterized protein n=1 Tax=Cacopsylla melanoneura TaxID=428564 RepID=A0A8D8W7S8_9HEMI